MNPNQVFRAEVERVSPDLSNTIDAICANVTASFNVEHKDDNTHGDVTADSVTTTGAIEAGTTLEAATTVTAGDGLYERGHAFAAGEWVDVTFNADFFTASAGTWTVDEADVTTLAMTQIGRTLTLWFCIEGTDVSNAGVSLKIEIQGMKIARKFEAPIRIRDAGTYAVGLVRGEQDNEYIECFATIAGGGFSITAADNTSVIGIIDVPVQFDFS